MWEETQGADGPPEPPVPWWEPLPCPSPPAPCAITIIIVVRDDVSEILPSFIEQCLFQDHSADHELVML